MALYIFKKNFTLPDCGTYPLFLSDVISDIGKLTRTLDSSDEVADAVCFLASGKASYITGQVLSINGGLYS